MVTVTDFAERTNAEGEKFFALIIQGGLEMVKSQQTGRYYATARKASVVSTFDERTCKGLIGTQIPGSIRKVECPPYDFTIKDTGEVIQLAHTYLYLPEGETVEENVFSGEIVTQAEL